jgi:hypothetical protein
MTLIVALADPKGGTIPFFRMALAAEAVHKESGAAPRLQWILRSEPGQHKCLRRVVHRFGDRQASEQVH